MSPRRRHVALAACLLLLLSFPRQIPGAAPPVHPRHTDRYGDALPPGAKARLGSVRWRHSGDVQALAFSADGKTLAGAGNGSLYLWDAETGRPVRRVQVYRSPSDESEFAVAFSPGAKLVAYGVRENRGRARRGERFPVLLADGRTGKRPHVLASLAEGVTALAFSPDGKVLAVGGPEVAARLYDTATGKLLRSLAIRPTCLAFSPEGRQLAAGFADGSISVWDTGSGKRVRSFPRAGKEEHEVVCLAFDRRARRLIVGGMTGLIPGARVRVLNLSAGELLRTTDPSDPCFALAPDGGSLALAHYTGVRLWDPATGKDVRELTGEVGGIRAPAFSPDGGRLAAVDRGRAVRLWDVATGKRLALPGGHVSAVTGLVFSPDGQRLASAAWQEGIIRLWDPARGRSAGRLEGHREGVACLAYSPDGRSLASASRDETLRVWNMAAGRKRLVIDLHLLMATAVAFAPDGRTLACVDFLELRVNSPVGVNPRGVMLYDAGSGQELGCLGELPANMLFGGPSASVAFAPDGQRVLGGRDTSPLYVWDVTTGKRLYEVADGAQWSGQAAFSPDGKTLAALDKSGRVCLIEAATGKLRGHLARKDGASRHLAYSPDGRALACGKSDSTVELWDPFAGKADRRPPGDGGTVTALAFSPDRRTLATGHVDGPILLWDVPARPAPRPGPRLSAHWLDVLWADLAAEDSARAFRAVRALVGAPRQAEELLRARLRPAPGPSADELQRLLAELDSDDFAERQRATTRLAELGRPALPVLREALPRARSLEVRGRLRGLLAKLGERPHEPDDLRGLRAVEVLEAVGSPEARRLLRALSKGSPAAVRTQEAQSALKRLAKRTPAD